MKPVVFLRRRRMRDASPLGQGVKPVPGRATLGSKLDETNGIGVGFDTLRVLFAVAVILCHQQTAMFGTAFPTTAPYSMISSTLLPMFFALAGFLIAGSAQRLSIPQYFLNRALRIFPALIVETILSALILGPIFTNLPLREYFLNWETVTYFRNLFGWVQFTLPGVFTENPHAGVNWSLWTVPYELKCYVLGALLLPLVRGRLSWFILPVALLWLFATFNIPDSTVTRVLQAHVFTTKGAGLFVSFILGYFGFAARHSIPWSPTIAAIIAAALLVVAFTGLDYQSNPELVWMAATYLTLFIGVSRLPKLPVLGRGDYSYGIYLYGIPVQQAVRATFPDLQDSAAYLLLVAVILLPLAMFSWHYVEKPVIRWRKKFSFIVRARGIASVRNAPPPAVDLHSGKVLSFGEAPEPDAPEVIAERHPA